MPYSYCNKHKVSWVSDRPYCLECKEEEETRCTCADGYCEDFRGHYRNCPKALIHQSQHELARAAADLLDRRIKEARKLRQK